MPTTAPSTNEHGAAISRERMDALIDGHYRAEEAGDIEAIVAGFTPGAEHDVAGRPGGAVHGGEEIADYYRNLFVDLRIERFEPVRRWHGDDHAVDESILHAAAVGRPLDIDGRGRRVAVRILHVFEFGHDLISRENAWLDVVALDQQLSE